MRLSELQTGEKAYITRVNGCGPFRKRILEMGFVRGQEVRSILNAPLNDPIKYEIMEYEVSLRRSEASMIEISSVWDERMETETEESEEREGKKCRNGRRAQYRHSGRQNGYLNLQKNIRVALVGNPNAGKTSIFNLASGAHEHVGNYSGVTVNSKEGRLKHKGYTFMLTDLPGTYSLSAYSSEELFVRRHLLEEKPDVIINVVSASALERNLFLTTELIDLEVPMVIALNMYDELEQCGRKFDYETFSNLINTPMVPTVGKRGEGISELLEAVIEVYNREEHTHVQIPYGRVTEKSIAIMERELRAGDWNEEDIPTRYLSIKLLEGDKEAERLIMHLPKYKKIMARCNKERKYMGRMLREDPETVFTNARYGFIAGGLKETLSEKKQSVDTTKLIDALVTHKVLGFPLFFFFLWVMFEATFRLGSYPMEGIEWLVRQLGNFVRGGMAEGPLKDLIVDGIIGGVGGVIVFLPNIVILYLFIAFMEDSGYMARAAFIMDKLMHRIGLHGKSFIPLIMGFGCNVPAVMSTRTIESRSNRLITMFIVPFMSCSARLPVYILFVGTFFPSHGSFVLLGLYAFGILIAALTARMLRGTLFRDEDTPFVMELPPYRMPTLKSVSTHMWERSRQYLQKMGGPILIGSIVIWFLGYFPRNTEGEYGLGAQITRTDTAGNMYQSEKNEREDGLSVQTAQTNAPVRMYNPNKIEGSETLNLQAVQTEESSANHTVRRGTVLDTQLEQEEVHSNKLMRYRSDNFDAQARGTEVGPDIPAKQTEVNFDARTGPEEMEKMLNKIHQENSYIGRIGRFIEPVMRPLGFDWKISVGLLSGMAAKEIVISTMGVLYTGEGDNQQSLQQRLLQETDAEGMPLFNLPVIISFLLFVLIYFPCIATIIAIKEESHSRRWALLSVIYSTGLAWVIAFAAYQVTKLLM